MPLHERPGFIYDQTYENEIQGVAYGWVKWNLEIPDFANPTRLFEKGRALQLVHPNPLMSLVADKVRFRDYVRLKGVDIEPPRLLEVYDDVESVLRAKLPRAGVLKKSNGCNQNQILGAGGPEAAELERLVWKWERDAFWRVQSEFHYRDIPTRYLVEEFLPSGAHRVEYKIFCVMGEVVHVSPRVNDGPPVYFGTNWQPVKTRPAVDAPVRMDVPRPPFLEQMIEVAQVLSADFAVARIDFMKFDDRLVLGEITMSPGAFRTRFEPPERDLELAQKMEFSRLPQLEETGRAICKQLGWDAEPGFGHWAGDPRLSTGGV
ncbi:ATP-grasp fold amidoligase family protein [Shimia biformata]|uniref:ATP-grasp fold amidoligase family protein n=1 Tax=Shimia biformata TaxID=1294299 RepID=UPI00194DCC55|nr:ATP-grasp fold amidoligase family protein [Shimia biformata]